MTKSDGKGLGRVAEKAFDSEAADVDISTADGVKESGVGRGAESTRDVGSEGGVFKIGDGRDGWGTSGENAWGIRGVVGRWGWDVESPHVLADSFRANKNGCRVSRGKDGGQCGGSEEPRARGSKEGEDGPESEIKKHQVQTRKGQGKEGEGSEDRSIGKGGWHEWELGWAHEVGKRREDRLPKGDMRNAGIGEDGRRGGRA